MERGGGGGGGWESMRMELRLQRALNATLGSYFSDSWRSWSKSAPWDLCAGVVMAACC